MAARGLHCCAPLELQGRAPLRMREGTPASVVVTQTLWCRVAHGLCGNRERARVPGVGRRDFSPRDQQGSPVPSPRPQLLRSPAWVCGLGAIPRRRLCCLLVALLAILSRPLLEATGSLPAFYSLETHTGDASHFPCSHACLPPCPWLSRCFPGLRMNRKVPEELCVFFLRDIR